MRRRLLVASCAATPACVGVLVAWAVLQPAPDAPPALRPTAHPPVPARLEALWFVPAEAEAAALAARFAGFQEALRAYFDGRHDAAVAALSDPGWRDTVLAGYAAYYAGLARQRLGALASALDSFRAILEDPPPGHLAEAATRAAGDVLDALDREAEAVAWYERALARPTVATAEILYRLAQAALAVGDRRKAAETLLRVYDEFPGSEQARLAATDLKALGDVVAVPGTRARYAKDFARAERLVSAGRYEEARSAWLDLRALAPAADRPRIDLRLAACEVALGRYRAARDRLRPSLDRPSPDEAERRYLYLSALRGLGRIREFAAGVRALARAFPDSPWTEAALDALATQYLVDDRDEQAIEVFRELYARFPAGRRAERAAWKAGWWAYRHGEFADAVRYFETAAATFPRSDYRPAYLYWAGRARLRMGDLDGGRDRLAIAVVDYGGSYYGRLAARALEALADTADGPRLAAVRPDGRAPSSGAPAAATSAAEPPTAALIRTLLALELYDAALDELEYARVAWGSTPALEATVAYVLNRQGDYRRAAVLMRRAYPQVLTADHGGLPDAILQIVFPLDYWDLIRRHATAVGIDPYLVAALVAQESMFDPNARSSANAYGLMQMLPATGRRLGRALGLRRVTPRQLADPDTNLRLGTRHLADLLQRFGTPPLALAAYNAGEQRVARWVRERPGLAPEEFIDDLPYPETQNYVRRILGMVEDYRRLYPSP